MMRERHLRALTVPIAFLVLLYVPPTLLPILRQQYL